MNLVDRIPIGKNYPCVINCIIEIPRGTSTKYEYDEELDIFKLNRCLYSSMNYTASYGFIPQTLALDNDPLDVVVYNNTPIDTGVLVEVKPIATLDMNDNGHKDYKVVCVPTSHIREYRSLKDLEAEAEANSTSKPIFLSLLETLLEEVSRFSAASCTTA